MCIHILRTKANLWAPQDCLLIREGNIVLGILNLRGCVNYIYLLYYIIKIHKKLYKL